MFMLQAKAWKLFTPSSKEKLKLWSVVMTFEFTRYLHIPVVSSSSSLHATRQPKMRNNKKLTRSPQRMSSERIYFCTLSSCLWHAHCVEKALNLPFSIAFLSRTWEEKKETSQVGLADEKEKRKCRTILCGHFSAQLWIEFAEGVFGPDWGLSWWTKSFNIAYISLCNIKKWIRIKIKVKESGEFFT